MNINFHPLEKSQTKDPHKFLLIAFVTMAVFANAQTKKVILENELTHAVETFYVLTSNPDVREGKYQKKQHGANVKGQYTNNKKSGIWKYIGRQGLEQKIDFDNNKVIFAKPFEVVKNHFIKVDSTYIEITPDEVPLYLGGSSAFYSQLNQTIRYPASARRMGVDGKVQLSALITKEGKMTELKVEKGLTADLDKEALRVINLLPNDWLPGKVNGQVMDIKIILYITFKLKI